MTEAELDPACCVVVLTGAGRGFCAGLGLDGYGVPPHASTTRARSTAFREKRPPVYRNQ